MSPPNSPTIPNLLPIEEVSRLLGCTPKTVRSWIHQGRLKATKPGRGYLVEEREVRAFIKRNLFKP